MELFRTGWLVKREMRWVDEILGLVFLDVCVQCCEGGKSVIILSGPNHVDGALD